MSKARTLIAGLLCALLHTPFAAAVPTYVLHEIPIEEGLSGRQTANGINEDGSVVGNLITSPDYAFIWSQATGATYFNHAGPAGGEWGASDINDNELVTGYYGGPAAWRGYIRYPDGSWDDLGQVPGYYEALPMAINNAGTVAGQTWAGAYTWGPPCIGDAGSGMEVLDPIFVDDDCPGPAHDINDAGQVVGYAANAGSPRRAWVYDMNLPGTCDWLAADSSDSAAYGVNQSGQIVGTSASLPVLWNSGTPQSLGTLGGGTGQARAVNDQGVIVGTAKTASDADHAFVWEDGHIYDLNDLVSADGWTLVAANDINNRGMIAGWGWHDGEHRAFALVPEPATLSLLVLLALSLPKRRAPALLRRRRK